MTEGAPTPPEPDAAPGAPHDRLDPEGLRRTVAEVLGTAPDRIGDDDNLVALGVDSVKVMTISARLRRHRIRVRFARMIEEPTLRAWWRLAQESAAAGPAPGSHAGPAPAAPPGPGEHGAARDPEEPGAAGGPGERAEPGACGDPAGRELPGAGGERKAG